MQVRKNIAMTLTLAFLSTSVAPAANLSPQSWNVTDRRHMEELQMNPFPPHARVIQGSSGLICDTGSPIAVYAGMQALKKGGSAADAAATVALTQIATELGSYISYAGELQLIYFDAKTKRIYSLGAGWNSYRGETNPGTIPVSSVGSPGTSEVNDTKDEGRKTLVPGFMAGIEAMHKRFGRLPLPELFEPAIWYAENGVTVTPLLAHYFSWRSKFLSRTAEGRQFMNQAGTGVPKAGDRFVQADLARTLRSVAQNGAKYMYTGAWGQQFVSAVQRDGGKVTMDDMAAYQPTWGEPVSTEFMGKSIFVPGDANEAGRGVLEALNFIEEMKLAEEQPYWKDPKVFSNLSRVLQFAEAGSYVTPEVATFQREHHLSFSIDDRATKAYARAMLPLLTQEQALTVQPESPHHSAGVVVIDRWGNVAALVHTINAMPWGSTGIVVGGVPLSDAAGIQQSRLLNVKPGARVPDDMAPSIVTEAGKPVLAVASIGASLLPETVRIILGVLGNHAAPSALLNAPPLLYNYDAPQPGESYIWKRQLVPEDAYESEFLQRLQSSGVQVRKEPKAQVLALRGTAAFATMDLSGHAWQSAEDPSVIDFCDTY